MKKPAADQDMGDSAESSFDMAPGARIARDLIK
jgi:hypothetical protein